MKALKNAWFKIDARSLGLFRVFFGVVLLADLFRRWSWIRDFYSNDGVEPNHNHIFNLREQGQVWSFLHSFSSVDEARFGFAVIFVVYVFYLVGYKTRAFQFVAFLAIWSLCSRNILTENAGNYAAVALAAFTLFLPLGRAFSVDAMLLSMRSREEKTDTALNDRSDMSDAVADATRGPGWSPVSLAAFAVLLQIAILYFASWRMQHNEHWSDGTALYYALHMDKWASPLGADLRGASPSLLAAWTQLFHVSELVIPILLLVPVALRWTRGVAVALNVFVALTLTLFFAFGMYGWTLLAATALFIPKETWERAAKPKKGMRLRVIYDADCGVCIWIARVLKRLDRRGHFTFVGNDKVLVAEGEGSPAEDLHLPNEVTPELVSQTVVVVREDATVLTRARAVSACVRALPLGFLVSWIFLLPGMNALYDFVAARRQRISVLMGKEACGIAERQEADAWEPPSTEVPPAQKLARRATGVLRDVLVAVVLLAAIAQAGVEKGIPQIVPQLRPLQAVAAWPRMLQRWDILADVTTTNEVMIVDAVTRSNKLVDTLTGKEPDFDLEHRRGTGLGQMWNDYLDRIHQKQFTDFQRAFRDYLNRGGPRWETTGMPENSIQGYDVYLVRQEIPAPGGGSAPPSEKEKLWTQARGGRSNLNLPILRPNTAPR